jgi:HEAT repeat protein
MQKDVKKDEALSSEVQEVMRSLVSAIRSVKIYPPNNPIFSQSVKKAHEALALFLKTTPEYRVGVQKTNFTYQHMAVGKDAQLNKAIAQDLFAKGVREIIFSEGLTEQDLLTLCVALALSTEELAMKNGIASILWEKGMEHIKVTEAGLDEVITTQTPDGLVDKPSSIDVATAAKKQLGFPGRSLVLGDLMSDPAGFGASMVELAKQTRAPHESVEDRLYTLYQEAGRKIEAEHADKREEMFDGLAKSILSLESSYRQGLVAGKLYGDLDAEIAKEQEAEGNQEFPSAIHEIQTGRFSNAWTVQQVATLLKKSSIKKAEPSTPPPSLFEVESAPIPEDLLEIAKELAEYTPEEMAQLKTVSDAGMESDIIAAAIRTLIFMIPLVKNPQRPRTEEQDVAVFSGVIHQLEDMLSYLWKKKDYQNAMRIIRAFQKPVDPIFKPRMAEALKKTTSKTIVTNAIDDLRNHAKSTPEYQEAYTYLSSVEREATEVLLELLAEEKDRTKRIFLLDLVKDLGKNQLALLGEHLSDGRWYFVRNIVNILGESKTDQAINFLRKAADHPNVRIRQEVIKGLISFGGKKAASVLAKLLRDSDTDVQATAIHAFADFQGIGTEEARPLMEFLEDRPLRKKELELTIEAIKALGKIGGRDAGEFLKGLTPVRWWKPRKLQVERRDAALRAIEEITRRLGHGR